MRGKSFGRENYRLSLSTMAESGQTQVQSPLEELIGRPIGYDDATWILTSAFIIFTMQSGFGLIESGMVTIKNETNIMVKNAIDIIFSGLSFWIVGFGLSFGVDEGTNAFAGIGYFITEVSIDQGEVYSMYFFQMALASTATTIVSGAMAERTNLKAYMLYSFVSTLSTCFPTHWIWGKNGFLRELGVIDIAGCSGVHLVGGAAGLAAAVMLGPRLGRFDDDKKRPQPCSMTNVMLGTFMLWWGWLGFNCGSTFGISGAKWKLASRSAVATLNASIGGGILAIIYSYIQDSETLDVPTFVTGIRGGLVAVTGICALAKPWEGLVIGFLGGLFACLLSDLMMKLKIDDPVNCVATHAGSAVWGMIAVALFVEPEKDEGFAHEAGLFKGGGWRLLGIQLLACVVTAVWGVVTTVMMLYGIEKTIGIRLTKEEEKQGCDLVEHGIGEESEIEEDETDMQQNQRRASASSALERLNNEDDEETKETKFTGAFVMRLPVIARNIRRKNQDKQVTDQEGRAEDETRGNDEDRQSSIGDTKGTHNTGAFWRLPMVLRNLRGSHLDRHRTDEEGRTNNDVLGCDEDQQASVDDSRGTHHKGASLMKLPIIARNLRRKYDKKRSAKLRPNDANISSADGVSEKEEDTQTSCSISYACGSHSSEIRRGHEDERRSDDLRSTFSVDSEIEDFIKREMMTPSETCYPMSLQKRTEDKCLQVMCKQGVLIDV